MAEGDDPPPPPPQATIMEAFQHFACLYIKYVQIFKRLEMCYDAMVHPQKRIDVKVIIRCRDRARADEKREVERAMPRRENTMRTHAADRKMPRCRPTTSSRSLQTRFSLLGRFLSLTWPRHNWPAYFEGITAGEVSVASMGVIRNLRSVVQCLLLLRV